MSASVVTATGTDSASRNETIVALDEAFDASFEVWSRMECADWAPHWSCGNTSSPSDSCPSQIRQLLEQARKSGEPQISETSPRRQLLAVPLGGKRGGDSHCAISRFETDSPELLLQLAKTKLREIQQEVDLARIREENEIFLKQVSEDFEELTFLRSVAERLALGERSHDVSELIAYLLPMLGEAASVEELYYFEGESAATPHMNQRWHSNPELASRFEHRDLQRLVIRFCNDAFEQPVVKNQIVETELYPELPDLHEFVLVAVSTAMGPIGWLLAINRRMPALVAEYEPLWRLSHNEFGTSEASLISTAAAMLASHAHNVASFAERESLLVSVVRTLVSAVESKDNYTCGHSERVALYGKRLASEVGYDPEACERLYLTGLLHDLGKIGVSDAVLKKEGELTPEEFAEIQKHPDLGWAILRELEPLEYVLPGVLHHHERVDGKGYPDQLGGDEIPRDGQLLAVVDAFDAMTSDRPYRNGMPVERAVEIFEQGAGVQWDANLVEAFLRILPDILAIKENYQQPPLPTRQKRKRGRGEGALEPSAAICPSEYPSN